MNAVAQFTSGELQAAGRLRRRRDAVGAPGQPAPRSVVRGPVESHRSPRRRGSVLVLVMTLLGVLFVAGITLMATMNFEAQLIQAEQQRRDQRAGVEAIVSEVDGILRQGLIAEGDGAFGPAYDPMSPTASAELPDYQSLISPIEPNLRPGVTGPIPGWPADTLVNPWFTDTPRLFRKEPNPPNLAAEYLTTSWISGWPDQSGQFVMDVDGDAVNDAIPADADGDGVVDALAIDVAALGFSDTQIAALKRQLNPVTNLSGRVYLALRVVPHGGMVNLNASHPTLINAVLGPQFDLAKLSQSTGVPDPDACYYFFRPWVTADPLPTPHLYAPLQEEILLRRRNLLPPRLTPPSLLHGNPLVNAGASGAGAGFGFSDLPTAMYPPLGLIADCGTYETVFPNGHRYWPFDPLPLTDDPAESADLIAGKNGEPYHLWQVRMEPFTALQAEQTANLANYDRRHLLTTVSYDDLLSRGQRVAVRDETGRTTSMDARDAMIAVNQSADVAGQQTPLRFEYADHPVTIPNGTAAGATAVCDWPTRDVCRFDPRKGRLQLSLPFLDEQFPCETLVGQQQQACQRARTRLIYDAFFLLVSNASGPYWEDQVCDPTVPPGTPSMAGTPGNLCAASTEFCKALCEGGDRSGQPCTSDAECPNGGSCPVTGVCASRLTQLSRRDERISRTAASLTANMIDYMDFTDGNGDGLDDGFPTRVALRSFDFTEATCHGGPDDGVQCTSDGDCPGGTCRPSAGTELGDVGLRNRVPAGGPLERYYVYGLERQPFITELAAFYDPTEGPDAPPTSSALELFNPYPQDLDGTQMGLWLFHDAPGPGPLEQTRINATIPARGFLVLQQQGQALNLPDGASALQVNNAAALAFVPDSVVYLVREVPYPNGTAPVVLDQFSVPSGSRLGQPSQTGPGGGPPPASVSLARPGTGQQPWTYTVGLAKPTETTGDSLGQHNGGDPSIRPVEVRFANTGTFTRPAPQNDPCSPQYNPNAPNPGVAFPTTGSMLLLMRHANRSLQDSLLTGDLAFTTWLDQTITWQEPPSTVGGGGVVTIQVEERTQVDNGRMPVFDLGQPQNQNNPTGERNFAHHADPGLGACCVDQGGGSFLCRELTAAQCQAGGGTSFALGWPCTAEACTANRSLPNGLETLPWGQYVFDYFTTLPLNGSGPYESPGVPLCKAVAKPKVDLNGLRVHGRININAAPWKVLSGLPLIPMNQVPANVRAKVRWGAGLVNPDAANVLTPQPGDLLAPDDQSVPIGNTLAQALVAYREARAMTDVGQTTWQSGDFAVRRGLNLMTPATRRGTGFLTVGELANVRHPGATLLSNTTGQRLYSFNRIDFGRLRREEVVPAQQQDVPPPDFIEAIATLVALNDWMTTRSDVFTVYGQIRGDFDPDLLDAAINGDLAEKKAAAADVDSRAIRFQETIDRIPALLGESRPRRIGQRHIGKYIDVRND